MRNDQSTTVPPAVGKALDALWAAGYDAYPVGGCVRDALLGRTPADWDLCTAARPEETMAVFSDRQVIGTGLKHGTVTVLMEGRPLEITTFRTEAGYGDGRHPDRVDFVRSLAEDLSRRDFTVNAMALDRDGTVIDLFGGQADLAAGLIRCVGDPAARFREDGLRLLRALRFAARLGFSVETETAAAVHENRDRLRSVSAERIFSELKGLLIGSAAGEVLRAFPDVIAVFIPELAPQAGFDQKNPWHTHDLWTHTALAVEAAPPETVLRLAMLLHDVGKPETFFTDGEGVGHFYGHAERGAGQAEAILRRLRCDNALREETVRLVRLHGAEPPRTKKGTRRLLLKLGEASLRRLIACWRADCADRPEAVREERLAAIAGTEALLEEILAAESCFSLRDLALSGRDLLAAGCAPGPAMGEVLRELFRLVTEEGLPNEREALLNKAQEVYKDL